NGCDQRFISSPSPALLCSTEYCVPTRPFGSPVPLQHQRIYAAESPCRVWRAQGTGQNLEPSPWAKPPRTAVSDKAVRGESPKWFQCAQESRDRVGRIFRNRF